MSISSLTSTIKARETAIGEKVMASKAVSVYWPAVKASGIKIPVSKNILLILGAGIFTICFVLIATAYLSQVDEHNELSDELTSVEGQTASIDAEEYLLLQSIADADDQIAQLDSQIIATQAQLTMPLWVSGIFRDLLVVAGDNGIEITDGVDITDISSVSQGTEIIAGTTYQAISVNMTVAGTDLNIYKFVDALSGAFSTGVLKTLSITIDEEDVVDPSATVLLTIYSL